MAFASAAFAAVSSPCCFSTAACSLTCHAWQSDPVKLDCEEIQTALKPSAV